MSDPELMRLLEAAEHARKALEDAGAAANRAVDEKHKASERHFAADNAVHEYLEALRRRVRGEDTKGQR